MNTEIWESQNLNLLNKSIFSKTSRSLSHLRFGNFVECVLHCITNNNNNNNKSSLSRTSKFRIDVMNEQSCHELVSSLGQINSIPAQILIRIWTHWHTRSSTHCGKAEVVITSDPTASFLCWFGVKTYSYSEQNYIYYY